MSGGVGPTCNDISLPKEETHEHAHSQPVSLKPTATPLHRGGFLTFRQLNALAVMIIMSASGMVSLEEFAFVVFSFIYIYFLSRVAFPQQFSGSESQVFDPKNKTLRLYVAIGSLIGLFAPIAYIFEGIYEGDQEGIKAAAPHVFLLASQVFMEGIAFSDRFPIPIKVFVPVIYNSRRLFTLADWLRTEVWKVEEGGYMGSARRLLVGRALAVANMAFWSFNLFGFLLPFYLPRAFKKYYVGSKVKD
ncbi:hypothetical protein SLE2022_402310 [Rubroshorea leprosula]